MKRLFSTIAIASLALSTFAGGLLTNTNQSASFVRNPARYASLETDAIYFNPAGTAFFKEGWAFSANWQMIWQQRDVENAGTRYDGKVYVPCMPTFFAAYKTGDWTFSGFFGMPGGGGNAQFDGGLPMFNTMGNTFGQLAPFFTGTQPTGAAYSQFESTQYLFSLQLGAAYKINDNMSVYAGLRTNYTSLSYEGGIFLPAGASTVNPLSLDLKQTGIAFAPVIGFDYKIGRLNIGVKYEFRAVNIIENETNNLGIYGNNANNDKNFENTTKIIDANAPLVVAAIAKPTVVAQVQEGVQANVTNQFVQAVMASQPGMTQDMAAAYVAANMQDQVAQKTAEYMASPDGETLVKTSIEGYVASPVGQATVAGASAAAKAGITSSPLASLQDGERFRNDAPAKLSIGASYDITDRIKVMGAYTYYFDKDAKIESLLGKANTMKTLSRNTYEMLAGVEVKVTDKLLLSTGLQFSDFGVNPSYLSDISFIDDSFMVGAGGKYSFNENWDLNFGFCYANYAHGAGSTGSKYLRKTYNASVGVDFRF